MVSFHDLCWNFLFFCQMICKQHIVLNDVFFRYESNLKPFTGPSDFDKKRSGVRQNHSLFGKAKVLIGRFIKHSFFFSFVEWTNFVMRMFRKWLLFYIFWLNSEVEKLVVHFEDLRHNILQELRRIMRFINMTHSDEIGKCVLTHPGKSRIHSATVDNPYKYFNKTFIHSTQTFYKDIKELLNKASYRWIVYFITIIRIFQ